jgi:hypothetical protein
VNDNKEIKIVMKNKDTSQNDNNNKVSEGKKEALFSCSNFLGSQLLGLIPSLKSAVSASNYYCNSESNCDSNSDDTD